MSLRDRSRALALAVACGLLWGVAASAMETLSQPTDALDAASVLSLAAAIGWTWVVCGLWWAIAALLLAEQRVGRLALLVPPLAFGSALLNLASWRLGVRMSMNSGVAALLGGAPPTDALFLHILWTNLFYGGLYLIAFAGFQRARRSQSLLAELASDRAEAEALRQARRLSDLRAQIQPGVLIEALEALQARFDAGPRAADRLFEELVRFLRSAMPAVRESRATLVSELRLVDAWARLRCAIAGRTTPAAGEDSWPELDPPFPPLRLLPLVQALSAGAPQEVPIRVRPTCGSGWVGAQLDLACGPPPDPPAQAAEAEQRLRRDLRALNGPEAALAVLRAADVCRISLRLPLPGRPDIVAGQPLVEEASS